MSNLNVWKDTGEFLFDTNLISYGLVKSGYMQFISGWTRKYLRSSQLDPNNGANWTTTTAQPTAVGGDSIWGFTVYNTISPIVFITGSGCMTGSAVSGNAITFYYTCADANTRFYCFDLMADAIAGSTYLKTWDTTGRITFNSLQPPLNVLAAVQAPVPGPLDFKGNYSMAYVGGSTRLRTVVSATSRGQTDCFINIPIGGEEYAAYLPWSRTCGITEMFSYPGGATYQYGVSEGVYGYNGGITFMFGASGGTSEANPSAANWAYPASFFNIPVDRYPVALVIRTSDLIFPYN